MLGLKTSLIVSLAEKITEFLQVFVRNSNPLRPLDQRCQSWRLHFPSVCLFEPGQKSERGHKRVHVIETGPESAE